MWTDYTPVYFLSISDKIRIESHCKWYKSETVRGRIVDGYILSVEVENILDATIAF